MEPSDVVVLINQIGFPIAAAIALFWLHRDTVHRYEKLFLELKKSIDNNSELIRKIGNA